VRRYNRVFLFYCTLWNAGKVCRTERYMGFLTTTEFGHMENNCAVGAQDCLGWKETSAVRFLRLLFCVGVSAYGNNTDWGV
jgi:hypothetical protein